LIGALVGGGLFAFVTVVQVLRSDVPPLRVLQPILVLTLIGATVGGLAAPLVGQAWLRRRGRVDPRGGVD
jgi:hypothetical protein